MIPTLSEYITAPPPPPSQAPLPPSMIPPVMPVQLPVHRTFSHGVKSKPPVRRLETKRERIKRMLEADMLLFGKVAIPEMFTEISAVFHHELAQLLLNPMIQKLLIMAPRKHAKSSLVACVRVLYHIMFDEGPKFIIIVSKTGPHAKRLLGTIKDVLDFGIKFRKIFGYWGRYSAREWSKDQIVLKDGTKILALGTGQQAVGLKEGHQRPTLIILDDPEDMDNTKTAWALRQNIRWLLKALVPTLDTKRGKIVVIGTPQCEGCMILKLFKLPGWTAKKYTGVNYDDEGRPTALWEDGCPYKYMMGEKADAEAAGELSVWYSEYMCSIVPDEEQLFKPEYNQYYRGWLEPSQNGTAFMHITHRADSKEELQRDGGRHSKLKDVDIIAVNVFMGVDPASSESMRADHSVNFKIAVDKDWNIYCLMYFRKRVPPSEHAKAIIEDYETIYPLKTTPEATGYQEALRDILRKFSHLWTKSGKKIYIPGLEAKFLPKEKKTKRHKTALHIHFYQRHVWLLEGMEAFESELITWREDKTKVDDLMDGVYLAIVKAYPPTHEYTGGQKSSGSGVRKDNFEEDWAMA